MTEHFHLSSFIFHLIRQCPKGAFRVQPLLILMIWSAIVLRPSPGLCHGVEGSVEKAAGYQVKAFYDDGEPLSYAAVEIKAAGENIAFQTGRTDRNGVMMFAPDRPGPWQAIISDGLGHRLALDLEVSGAPPAAGSPGAPAAQVKSAGSKPQNIITGLAVIFGLFGILYGWRGRRSAPA